VTNYKGIKIQGYKDTDLASLNDTNIKIINIQTSRSKSMGVVWQMILVVLETQSFPGGLGGHDRSRADSCLNTGGEQRDRRTESRILNMKTHGVYFLKLLF